MDGNVITPPHLLIIRRKRYRHVKLCLTRKRAGIHLPAKFKRLSFRTQTDLVLLSYHYCFDFLAVL